MLKMAKLEGEGIERIVVLKGLKPNIKSKPILISLRMLFKTNIFYA